MELIDLYNKTLSNTEHFESFYYTNSEGVKLYNIDKIVLILRQYNKVKTIILETCRIIKEKKVRRFNTYI